MSASISHTTVDCHHAYQLSEWWKQVIGYVDQPDDPNEPGHEECLIQSPDGRHRLLFIEVPDVKQVKNRVHVDLRPDGTGSREEELDRLLRLGATQVADHRLDDGRGWVVLADPEGNEFCILRGLQEIAAAQAAVATP
jgi:hypothetical protein